MVTDRRAGWCCGGHAGRLDRKIEFPHPDRRQKRMVFQACTAKMNLGDEVDLEDYVNRPEKISAAVSQPASQTHTHRQQADESMGGL